MIPFPLILKFYAIKNAVALVLIKPASTYLRNKGMKYPMYCTSCRFLTHGYYRTKAVMQSKIRKDAERIPENKVITPELELEFGSKFMAYSLITTGVGFGLLFLTHTHKKHKHQKTG